ncbi:S-methyl-5'-thioadenosine phosphorylase [Microbacterium sp. HD4P20]|uniref:S-methyl-5'-thioadenosine phosphorylase n=1 Tax=Microbacterium sp. HD4P20 TaxID=2864874 RepID=UPI001C63C9CC|nr:S-methyl-5'-thioadenosine phosphorylase [Microbacterium sp. HD4P20]MCP2637624.1 S-methyl-5'-thioadenosine phosphorylase [Microbacterium sp. HD4P20]
MSDQSLAAESAEPPRIGVIGGSGLYELLDEPVTMTVPTPYGPTSAPLAVGRFGGVAIAFLARHGMSHGIPPHRVNYRANMWALAHTGVRAIFASSAVGSLDPALAPDTFVVPDQLIDRTSGRADTYFDGDDVQHLAFADPFCPELRSALTTALDARGEPFAATGTTAVIAGPRFSTRAESRMLRTLGADIVNMTQYPEAALAAELGVGYASLSFVTDSDAGTADAATPAEQAVTADAVFARLTAAHDRIVAVLEAAVAGLTADYQPRSLVSPDASARVLAAAPKHAEAL